jgi:NitT/TauT family transport system ATP-binding protein
VRVSDVDAGALVEISDVTKVFETSEGPVHALAPVDIGIEEGSVVCLLGPSGCGKSTLMLMVAGLETPSTGSIAIGGKPVTGPYTELGVVFQQDLLLEWRTALDNVLMQFALRGIKPSDHEGRARELLEMVGVGEFAGRHPRQLSGGMRQRVSICRALAHDPPLLLMDEPFGALDALTREQIMVDFARIVGETRKTVLFITHSIDEAVFLGDRVLLLSPRPGRVLEDVRIDLPRPRTPAVKETPEFVEHVRSLRGALAREGVLTA